MIVDVSNKVIVVTGASRGIGSEIARAFAREQANVVINYRNSEAEADKLLDEIRTYNTNCMKVKADITNQKDVSALYKSTLDTYGCVDILINNAGVSEDSPIQLMRTEQWMNVLNTNLTGAYFCCKAFSKAMARQKFGKIINIASLKGQEGYAGQVNYSASKAGLIGLTKALAKELGKFNIAVNAVCPGFITTDLNRNNMKEQEIASEKSVLSCEYALKDLVAFLLLLASDHCRGISGREFNIDSRL